MNIDNKYIVDGLTIDRKWDGEYSVFTVPTQHFSINSLDELTNERFEIEIERQKQYEKYSSELMGLYYSNQFFTKIKVMNNERYNQIIKEVYIKYLDYLNEHQIHGTWYEDSKSFEKECRANKEFAEKWGLKIEERELNLEERNDYYTSNYKGLDCESHEELNKLGDIPTKLITITYQENKIEVYE